MSNETSDKKQEELKRKLRQLAGEESYNSGVELYEDESVLDILGDSRGIDTRVANSAGRFEKVRITIKKNYFSARCTCRNRANAICEHAVAAFLQLYEDRPEIVPFPLDSPSMPSFNNDGATDAPETEDAPKVNISGSSAMQKISFSNLLADLKSVQGHIILKYIGPGFPNGESRWNNCKFELEISHEGKVYSGGNLKRLVDGGVGSAGMYINNFSPQDQQIMRFIGNTTEIVGSSFTLNASDVGSLFHRMIGFQRLYANNIKLNINKNIAELVLMISDAEGGKFKIDPRLQVKGSGVLPTKKIDIISSRSGFWLGYNGQYWWIPAISGPNWLNSFINGESAIVSDEDYAILRELCNREVLPVKIIDSKDQDLATVAIGKMRPVIAIDWQKKSLDVRLEFSYNSMRVTPGSSRKIIWVGSKYVSRDEAAEEAVIRELKDMGFNQLSDPIDAFRLQSLERLGAFIDETLPELIARWEVYYSADFQMKSSVSGDIGFSVSTVGESRDWFELKYDFHALGDSHASWDKVVHAILMGHNYVRLDDGGVAKITDEFKTAMEASLDSAFEKSDDGLLKFSNFNALFIGNMLKDADFENEGNWQTYKNNITNFNKLVTNLDLPEDLESILRPYQRDGVAWLNSIEDSNFHGILADEMGLGKTLQALAAIQYSHSNSSGGNTSLIICPTSLVHNWASEAAKFVPGLKVGVMYGNTRTSVVNNLKNYDLVITSYALLRRDIGKYEDFEFHYVALDEAQHIKNYSTANAKTCKKILARHRLILTGTPIENSLRELWSLFDFLLPGYLGSAKDFQDRFEKKTKRERSAAVTMLAEKVRPFMLRRCKKEVCEELPEKIEQIIYCDLSDKQRTLYDKILIEAKQMLEMVQQNGLGKHRLEMLSVLMRLRQLCCHPTLLPNSFDDELTKINSAKTELFKELVLESIDSNHRMLVFSQFTGLLAILRQWLDEENIKYEYLDGSTQNRMRIVNRFNRKEDIPVFLLSLKAGGTGLNLTGADTVIHYDQWWNPMVEDQATDRSHRIGQKRQVTAIKLVTRNTVEEKVLKLQDTKRELFNQIMAGVPADINKVSADDFAFLLEE